MRPTIWLLAFAMLIGTQVGHAGKVRPADDARLRLFDAKEIDHWAYQPIARHEPPELENDTWSRNSVDRFILRKLRDKGLTPAPEADRGKLMRRLYYDLVGLPPTAEEVDAFVADRRPDAYERLVDRLLASPEYGERWAQHWLDLVRFAESDGYRQDAFRPHAWRYRDYVIRALNDDKPYDQFVIEQLAGDEVAPDNPEAIVATGLLRLGVYEYNQSDVESQWDSILNELTGVTGEVFLGMSIGCAECHDHKFDPILQKDFFRLRAFFEATSFRDDVPVATPDERAKHDQAHAAWQHKTSDLRQAMRSLELESWRKARKKAVDRFPNYIQRLVNVDFQELSPREKLLAELANRQVPSPAGSSGKVSGNDKERWQQLKSELDEFNALRPNALPRCYSVADIGPQAPPTTVPDDSRARPIAPGFPSVVDPTPAAITPPSDLPTSTGRRTALARWIVRGDNQLSMRVIVNRLWQHHFGEGLVTTVSDFGHLGSAPSHAELLDWLTAEFVDGGMHFKPMHRLLVTSATYRQSVAHPDHESAVAIDPENRLRWRASGRRLTAEELRDSILQVTGRLDPTHCGPSVSVASARRGVYTKSVRNSPSQMMSAFDSPNCVISSAARDETTTPIQALFMLNAPWLYQQANTVAARAEKASTGDVVGSLFRTVYSRDPTPAERRICNRHLGIDSVDLAAVSADVRSAICDPPTSKPSGKQLSHKQRLADLAHVMLNSHQFLYIE